MCSRMSSSSSFSIRFRRHMVVLAIQQASEFAQSLPPAFLEARQNILFFPSDCATQSLSDSIPLDAWGLLGIARLSASIRSQAILPVFSRRNSLRTQDPISRHVTNSLHILAVGPLARLFVQSVYCALHCLWRLSECPDERTAHPLAISKAVLPGNFLGGEAASLHHQPCRFHPQPFYCLRG
jgi:hypothetical protein